jgi:hypothetical protein
LRYLPKSGVYLLQSEANMSRVRAGVIELRGEYRTVSLADIAGYVEREEAECAEPLDPCRIDIDTPAPIVEWRDGAVRDLVDGYHRVAGMRRWADDRHLPYDSVTVRVLAATDPDLIAAAAEPGYGQMDAIRALYERTGPWRCGRPDNGAQAAV